MAWEVVIPAQSVPAASVIKDPNALANMKAQGRVDGSGYMWVRTVKDPTTGVVRQQAAAGDPNVIGEKAWEGGDVSSNAGLLMADIPQPSTGDVGKQLGDFTRQVETWIGTGYLSANEGVDLIKNLANKIAGKTSPDQKMQSGASVVNNLLALAPKVRPGYEEAYGKGVAAVLMGTGVLERPQAPAQAPQPQAGFMGGLGQNPVTPAPSTAPIPTQPETSGPSQPNAGGKDFAMAVNRGAGEVGRQFFGADSAFGKLGNAAQGLSSNPALQQIQALFGGGDNAPTNDEEQS